MGCQHGVSFSASYAYVEVNSDVVALWWVHKLCGGMSRLAFHMLCCVQGKQDLEAILELVCLLLGMYSLCAPLPECSLRKLFGDVCLCVDTESASIRRTSQ
jgi:hypothetical protein